MSTRAELRESSGGCPASTRWSIVLSSVGILAFAVLILAAMVRPMTFYGSDWLPIGPVAMLTQFVATLGAVIAYLCRGWRAARGASTLAVFLLLANVSLLGWIVYILSHIPSV